MFVLYAEMYIMKINADLLIDMDDCMNTSVTIQH